MRMSVTGKTKQGIAYLLDWIQLTYKNEEGHIVELTLDILGEVSIGEPYPSQNGIEFNCYCKTPLNPWTEHNIENDVEKDLYEMPEDELSKLYPYEKLINIIKNSTDTFIGLYPWNDEDIEKAKEDVITDCQVYFDEPDLDITLKCKAEINI